jgi:hypothetical protein
MDAFQRYQALEYSSRIGIFEAFGKQFVKILGLDFVLDSHRKSV